MVTTGASAQQPMQATFCSVNRHHRFQHELPAGQVAGCAQADAHGPAAGRGEAELIIKGGNAPDGAGGDSEKLRSGQHCLLRKKPLLCLDIL